MATAIVALGDSAWHDSGGAAGSTVLLECDAPTDSRNRKRPAAAQITSRNHRIIQAYKAGGTAREIAPLYGLSPAMVRIVLIRCRAWNPAGPAAINQARFAERWNAGDGLCAMASHYGTGARRLVKLAAHLGLPPPPPPPPPMPRTLPRCRPLPSLPSSRAQLRSASCLCQ